MKNVYIILMCILLPWGASAQKWEVGAVLGAGTYEGDIHCRDFDGASLTDYAKFAYGIHAKYLMNDIINFRLGLMRGKLGGNEALLNDIGRQNRGFSFTTDITEVAALIEWDILGKKRHKNGVFHKILSPYLFAGIGAAFTNPNVNFNGRNDLDVSKDKKEIKKTHLALPVGLGLKYDLTDRFNLGVEGGLRLPTSDYIDGVSQSANPDANDYYAFAGIIGNLKIGNNDMDGDGVVDEEDKCPDVKGLVEMQGCPDLDGDGLSDVDDKCPNIYGDISTDGCPDADGDGVMDDRDACPQVAGDAKFKGCPDADGDGIQDSKDACPEVAGDKAFNGCPDSDGDGVSDAKDICPDVAGLKSRGGCPDSDGDGVLDKNDKCPNISGSEQADGCPDADADGVADSMDKCPNSKGSYQNGGCPTSSYSNSSTSSTIYGATENATSTTYHSSAMYNKGGSTVTSTTSGSNITYYPSTAYTSNRGYTTTYSDASTEDYSATKTVDYSSDLAYAQKNVLFYSGTSRLKSSSKTALKKIAKIMMANPDKTLNISGYTDNVGDDDDNECLSRQRAKSCFKYLKAKGISEDRMNYEGYGETNPIDDNSTENGRKNNRRVEFSIF